MYREHFKEHPEEYLGIAKLKAASRQYEADREKRKKEKLKRIEECRRALNEERTRI